MESEHCGIRVLRGGNIKPFQLCTKPDDIFIPQSKVKEDILYSHSGRNEFGKYRQNGQS